MDVRPGYKQTEVGLIPDDWDVSTVGREFDVQLGKMLDAEKNVGDLKPYIGNSNVQWGAIDVSKLPVMRMTHGDLQRFRLIDGDLLVCEGGEVGRSAIWTSPVDECYYQKALHRLRPLRGFDPRLMVEFLRLWSRRGDLANHVTQTSIAHLPREKFVEVPLPVPPGPEQSAIVGALGNVDALLATQDALIAKKRAIKQGAMQALLTCRRRLPGFKEPWKKMGLDQLADIRSGGTPSTSRSDFWDGDVPWVTPTDITALNGRKSLCDTKRKITSLGLKSSSAEIIPEKSVIMTSRATIGDCAINEVPLATNQGFKSFVPNELVDADFLYYLLSAQKRGFMSMCAGSTFLEIGKAQVAGYQVSVPEKTEQVAIAKVLCEIDIEIDALEAQRAKTAQIKQGMMQQLLTGRIRLI